MSTKGGLLLPLATPAPRGHSRAPAGRWIVEILCFIALALLLAPLATRPSDSDAPGPSDPSLACRQNAAMVPHGNTSWIDRFTNDKKYILEAAERLGGAVRIPTESFDSTRGVPPPPSGPDPIHDGFPKLHAYLQSTFPLVHAHLERTIIHRYALLYTWKGSDSSLSPLLLMAHQDTVPVLPDTLPLWTHPPFSGYVDEENDAIWGRGSVDTKSTLVGSLEAIEVLLSNGFSPRRTVYLAFGFDEEISGMIGARAIAEYMKYELKLAGKIGMIVDEGLDSFQEVDGIHLAVVSIAEKGYQDYSITVETKGGHSSIPPAHTGIGLAAQLVTSLESNPFPVHLSRRNPFLGTVACIAAHAPVPDPFLRDAIARFDERRSDALAKYLSDKSLNYRYRMASSQAIDIISGGLKVNALPEKVLLDINNRVSIDSSIQELQGHIIEALKPTMQRFELNYTIVDFRDHETVLASKFDANAVDSVMVRSKLTDRSLEPSPISSSESVEWKVVEGTIHHVYERNGNPKYVVAPGLMAGNTDTAHFWDLSSSIYRFAPMPGGYGYHTVNERGSISGYAKAVEFFHELIRNYDAL